MVVVGCVGEKRGDARGKNAEIEVPVGGERGFIDPLCGAPIKEACSPSKHVQSYLLDIRCPVLRLCYVINVYLQMTYLPTATRRQSRISIRFYQPKTSHPPRQGRQCALAFACLTFLRRSSVSSAPASPPLYSISTNHTIFRRCYISPNRRALCRCVFRFLTRFVFARPLFHLCELVSSTKTFKYNQFHQRETVFSK